MAGLTSEEQVLFGDQEAAFTVLRDGLFLRSQADPSIPITPQDSAGVAGPDKEALAASVFTYLQSHGLINFGTALPPDAEAPPEDPAIAALRQKVELKRTIVNKLHEILRAADLQTVTEKSVREQVQAELGIDVKEHKAFIKKYVTRFVTSDDPDIPAELVDSDAEQQEELEEKTRPKQVIVVGAGAAGLAAAHTLKRCGVQVLVLEAEEQSGGRCVLPTEGAVPPPCDVTPLPLLPAPLLPHLAQPPTLRVPQDPVARGVEVLRVLAAQQGLGELLSGLASGGGGGGSGPGGLVALQQVPLMEPATGTWVPHEVQLQAISVLEQLWQEVQASATSTYSQYTNLADALTHALRKHQAAVAAASTRQAAAAALALAAAAAAMTAQAVAAAEQPAAAADDAMQVDGGSDAAGKQEGTAEAASTEQAGVTGSGEANGDGQGGATASVEDGSAPPPAAVPPAPVLPPELSVPVVPTLPKEVVRVVRWYISALHNAQGVSLTNVPVSQAAQLQLYLNSTDTSTSNCSDTALPDGLSHLGILQPAATTSASLPLGSCQRLLAGLCAGLDIRYGQRVTEVFNGYEGDVTVMTEKEEEFHGIAVVLAVPVAALQPGGIRLRPPLPAWRADVVNRVRPALPNRHTLLQFSSVLPPPPQAPGGKPQSAGQRQLYGLLAIGEDDLPQRPLGTDENGEAQEACGVQGPALCEAWVADGNNLLLSVDLTNPLGEVPEYEDDLEPPLGVPGLMQALHQGLVGLEPAPVVSWTLGAGAAMPSCDMQPQEKALLGMPNRRTVFFAGEWSAPAPLSGSLAGALLSGIREASRLVKLAKAIGEKHPPSLLVDDEQEVEEKVVKALIKERQKQLKNLKRQREQEAEADATSSDEDDGTHKKISHKDKKAKHGGRAGMSYDEIFSDEEDLSEGSDKEGGRRGTKGAAKKRKGQKSKEEPDEEGAKAKAKRLRSQQPENQEPEPYDSLKYQAQLRRREEARQDIKAAHKAVLQASQGRAGTLLDMVQGCNGLDNRQQLLYVLSQAPQPALESLSTHQHAFVTLNSWLKESIEDRSFEHLAVGILKLLLNMPGTAAMLRASGLMNTVKQKCLDSYIKDIKKAASDLWANWLKRFKTIAGPTSSGTGRQDSASSTQHVSRPAPPPPPSLLSAPTIAAAARASKPAVPPPPPPPSLPASARQTAAVATGSANGGASAGPAAAAAPPAAPAAPAADELLKALNPELAAQLAAEEERLRQRQQALEAAAQQRLAAQPLETNGASKLPTIRTFNEFSVKKAPSSSKPDSGHASKHPSTSSKAHTSNGASHHHHHSSSKSDKRQRDKPSSSSQRPSSSSQHQREQEGKPSDGSSKRHSGSAGAGGSQAPEGEGVNALRDWISKLLKPHHVEKKIDGKQFREIRDKVVAKICESTSAGSIDKHWLEAKPSRKEKVKGMVDKYLEAAVKK